MSRQHSRQAQAQAQAQADAALQQYSTYDEHVDVVSSMEYMFTRATGMRDTVAHFERFPRIKVDDKTLTPDFTVLFADSTGIVGEVAKLALAEGSVDKLTHQIGEYAALTALPDSADRLQPVRQVDVLLLVQMEVGLATVRRVIKQRFADDDHDYAPARPPCVAQYGRSETKYTLQRIPDPANGVLDAGDRQPDLNAYLSTGLNVQAHHFADIKVARAFINDPVPPLYLASHLLIRTWPTQHGGGTADITVVPADTGRRLQQEYGHVRIGDVTAALELLDLAGLAARNPDGSWLVSRHQLGRIGSRDVPRLLVDRITSKTTRRQVPATTRDRRPSAPSQEPLF